MTSCLRRFVACLGLGSLALLPGGARGQSAPILLDGFFVDWTGAVEHTDPAGDGAGGGIDLRAVDAANDAESFFLRFETTVEIPLQEVNNLVLYLDTDQNASTGSAVSGIGAELRWQFGARVGTFFRQGTSSITVFQDDLRLRQLPSITSNVFELSLGRDVRPDGVRLLFPGNGTRILLRHEVASGDQAPDVAQSLTYLFDGTFVPAADPIPLTREQPGDVRIVTWNVVDLELDGGGWNATSSAAADRVFSALDPDVICFQEIYDNSAVATAALVESWLPSGVGEAWFARENSDVIVVSRFPVLGQWNLDGAAGDHNIAVLLDTQPVLGRTLLLAGAHYFCCTNDAGRQAEVDRMMALWRDAKGPGGSITVPQGTMFAVTGDLNLVGQSQQLRTLREGDIVDQVTFGPDFTPDWNGAPLADVVSRQTEKRFAYTWRNDFGAFAPGRLDFHLYTSSVVTLGNHFSLYTPEMSVAQRNLYGLQANDVTTVSDHLPHTADYRATSTDVAIDPKSRANAWATIRLLAGSRGGPVRLRLALERPAAASVEFFDVRGAQVGRVLLGNAPLQAGERTIEWNRTTQNGARVARGVYVARLTARDASGMALVTSTKVVLE